MITIITKYGWLFAPITYEFTPFAFRLKLSNINASGWFFSSHSFIISIPNIPSLNTDEWIKHSLTFSYIFLKFPFNFLIHYNCCISGLPTRLEEEIKTCFPEAVHVKVSDLFFVIDWSIDWLIELFFFFEFNTAYSC